MVVTPATPGKHALRVAEGALLVAIAAMGVLALAFPSRLPASVGVRHLAVAAALAVAARTLGEGRAGWRRWVKELLPVPFVPYVFLNLGALIPLVNPAIGDAMLERWDRALLGADLQAALFTFPLPVWGADLLTVAYSTYFFLSIGLVVGLVWRRDPQVARVAAALILTFLVSYAGYFVVPAHGPRSTIARGKYETLPDGIVGGTLRHVLDDAEATKTDAFPSGHTMVTLATLALARRRLRRYYLAILPVSMLLIAATVFLTYHWVVDLLAAVPLTVMSFALAALLAGPVSLARTPGQAAAAARPQRLP